MAATHSELRPLLRSERFTRARTAVIVGGMAIKKKGPPNGEPHARRFRPRQFIRKYRLRTIQGFGDDGRLTAASNGSETIENVHRIDARLIRMLVRTIVPFKGCSESCESFRGAVQMTGEHTQQSSCGLQPLDVASPQNTTWTPELPLCGL